MKSMWTARKTGVTRVTWVTLVVLGVLVLFFLLLPKSLEQRPPDPIATKGVLDLTNWNFEKQGIVNLKGEWEFYWQELLTSEAFMLSASPATRQWVQVPNVWTEYETADGVNYPGHGYATYRLQVRTNTNESNLALKIPDLSTSCKIMIDGSTIATCGVVSADQEQAVARYVPQNARFSPEDQTFTIIVQVSNYLYDRGGMWYAMELGTEAQIDKLRENEMALGLILLGVFFFMSLYHAVIYLLRPKELVALYFAIGCLIGVIRLLVVDDMFLLNLIPGASVELITGLIYFTYYGGVAVLTLYLRQLYPHEFPALVARIVASVSALFLATVILFPLNVYTYLIRYYHLFMLGVGLYMIAGVALAYWRKRDGAGLQCFGISVFVLSIFHDIFFNLFYISEWINHANTIQFLERQIVLLGLFVLVFVQAIVLARRFTKAFHAVEHMSERLLTLDRLKDEFLVNTSHELKTPLHGVINLSQSMMEGANGPLNAEQKNNLHTVVSVARRLTNLIQDLMDFSKLKSGELAVNKRNVSIQAILEANLEIFRHYIEDKPIHLEIQLPENLPPVYADENRVVQILYNLIGNAIKFTEQGMIHISAYHQADQVIVRIKDTGIGIPSNKLDQIFQSFEQVGASVAREYGGIGLGLTITRQLVALNGGELSVISAEGEGSVFSFTLPVSRLEQSGLETAISSTAAQLSLQVQELSTAAHEVGASYEGREITHTILAVDDDPTNLQVILTLFSQEPYRILTARDGEEALQMLADKHTIDLVILDVMMPKLSGYEVTRRIRAQFTLLDLPILLVTVKNEPEDLVSGFAAGANDFLTKPFHSHEIKARVRTLLELKSTVEKVIQAELDFLRAQIKPHFLYNALNTIVGIIPRNGKKASHLLRELSHFLRGSFDFQSNVNFVSLRKELELVQSYVEIEKARFEDRLDVHYQIDPEVKCMLPPLTIQPLVENAIRHGVMNRIEGGTVRIQVHQDEEAVYIRVEDDGAGMSHDRIRAIQTGTYGQSGVGLTNIDQRLRRMYGTGLEISSIPGKGTQVQFIFPRSRGEPHDSGTTD